MALKVFISHSTGDLGIVYQFSDSLQMNGLQTYVAELYPQPGIELPAKIENAINWSDCVIAIMTKDGDRSAWVFGISQGVLWLVRTVFELLWPVRVPLFFLSNPTTWLVPLLLTLAMLYLVPLLGFKKELLKRRTSYVAR